MWRHGGIRLSPKLRHAAFGAITLATTVAQSRTRDFPEELPEELENTLKDIRNAYQSTGFLDRTFFAKQWKAGASPGQAKEQEQQRQKHINALIMAGRLVEYLRTYRGRTRLAIKTRKSFVTIELPDGFNNTIPPQLQQKIYYDDSKKCLIFEGVMKDQEKAELLLLPQNPEYQKAIKRLFVYSRRESFTKPQ